MPQASAWSVINLRNFYIMSLIRLLMLPAFCLSLSCAHAVVPDVEVAVENGGFEQGLAGWTVTGSASRAESVAEAFREGARGLRLGAEKTAGDTMLVSARFPLESGRAYRLTFMTRVVSGGGMTGMLRFFDEQGNALDPGNYADERAEMDSPFWRGYDVTATPPPGAATVAIVIAEDGHRPGLAYLDQVELNAFVPVFGPPRESVYKISPTDTARLTPADVPGPDGLVYPDWRKAGVSGGIPVIKTVVGPDYFAGYEGKDISGLLKDAMTLAAAAGGGAVEIPAGTFLLDQPVVLRQSGVVVRGAGKEKTRLIFQQHIPYGELRSMCWTPSGVIGPYGAFEIQANPANLVGMRVTSGSVVLGDERLRDHWGNRFAIRLRGALFLEKLGPGRHRLDAEVTYANGDRFTGQFEVEVSATPQPDETWIDQHGALIVAGGGLIGERVPLAATAKRGDNRVKLPRGHGFKPGDRLALEAPATPAWNKIVGNISPWGTFRTNHYEVISADDESVVLAQALRIEFPLSDAPWVQRIRVVERAGFEGFTLEQKVFTTEMKGEIIPLTLWYPIEDLWTNGVTFTYAWSCWVSDVKILNSGRNPLYLTRSKFCEVRGVDIDGALFKGGGGTGYVGFETSFDCLMENVTTRNMRHAPNVQWGAAGNVVRDSRFIGCDGQWHAGWTQENLYENNVIEQTAADAANGAYGHGLFASGPKSGAHGPQGPRNVVYNNDIVAPKDGVHMLGGNEAWFILHNRFRLAEGRGIYGKERSFDHVIRDNVFILENVSGPGVLFGSPDCTGIEVTGNRFYGDVREVAGFTARLGTYARVNGNTVDPIPAQDTPSRPQPLVPSIFLWQRNQPAK